MGALGSREVTARADREWSCLIEALDRVERGMDFVDALHPGRLGQRMGAPVPTANLSMLRRSRTSEHHCSIFVRALQAAQVTRQILSCRMAVVIANRMIRPTGMAKRGFAPR